MGLILPLLPAVTCNLLQHEFCAAADDDDVVQAAATAAAVVSTLTAAVALLLDSKAVSFDS